MGLDPGGSAVILILLATLCAADEPTLAVRLDRPDIQLARLLKLFDGTPVDGPAAAWAGWKLATGGTLGKPAEAAIAALNPSMVAELKTLDGATLAYRPPARWWARVPADDGTFAALATAMALSGGAAEPALGDAEIDRVGPPGSPLLARRGRALVAAAVDRGALAEALGASRLRLPEAPDGGWSIAARVDPTAAPEPMKDAVAALSAWGVDAVGGVFGLNSDGMLMSTFQSRLTEKSPTMRPLDLGLLDRLPADGAMLAVGLGLDPGPRGVSSLFAAADRVEKTLPGRSAAGPLRARVDLALGGLGVRAEAEVWPFVAGVAAALYADESGRVVGARVVLGATGPAATDRLARSVSRVARALGPGVSVVAIGGRVEADWGEVGRGATIGASIRSAIGDATPSRVISVSTGRLPGLAPRLSRALRTTEPVIGWGVGPSDRLRWGGLRRGVAAFLDGLPMKLPNADRKS